MDKNKNVDFERKIENFKKVTLAGFIGVALTTIASTVCIALAPASAILGISLGSLGLLAVSSGVMGFGYLKQGSVRKQLAQSKSNGRSRSVADNFDNSQVKEIPLAQNLDNSQVKQIPPAKQNQEVGVKNMTGPKIIEMPKMSKEEASSTMSDMYKEYVDENYDKEVEIFSVKELADKQKDAKYKNKKQLGAKKDKNKENNL